MRHAVSRHAEVDDEYDVPEYSNRTVDQADAEAHRLAAHPHVPAEPTDTRS